MQKEKWLLKEIEGWRKNQIVSAETADTLMAMYREKKSVGLMTLLFSIVGSLLVGMGVVLLIANNWWYSLPLSVRAGIGFLPLLISEAFVFFVYMRKMESVAFRESAAILNMAGVFASIAFVGQIFHLPGDFTNYLLVCGILFLPTMLVMNAVSPLIVFYWTAINGGLFFSDELGFVISLVMFIVGSVFALRKCRAEDGKSGYLSLTTALAAFSLIFVSALKFDSELTIVLYAYSLLLICAVPFFAGGKNAFSGVGEICFLVLTVVLTYRGMWEYEPDFHGVVFFVMSALLVLFAIALFVKNIIDKKYNLFSMSAVLMLVLRGVWCIFALSEAPFGVIFMIACNVVLLALSVLCILKGVRDVDLYNANVGMVTLSTLVILRFFDSELPLSVRGVVFLVLGAGFLLFNSYLVRTKKKNEEGKI